MEHKVTIRGRGPWWFRLCAFHGRGPDLPPGCCEVWPHHTAVWLECSTVKPGFRGVRKRVRVRGGWKESEAGASELLRDCRPPYRATPQSAPALSPETPLSTVKAPRQAATVNTSPCSLCSVWFLKGQSPLDSGKNLSISKVWFLSLSQTLGPNWVHFFPASPAPMPSPLKLMTD